MLDIKIREAVIAKAVAADLPEAPAVRAGTTDQSEVEN